MSVQKRSALMAKIRCKGTRPEIAVAALLKSDGFKFEEHPAGLPGKPDFVIMDSRLAIFVDGDFFHGWRFHNWRLKLSEAWERKIEGNIRRDRRNRARLRRLGWQVIRIWEHQIERNPKKCLEKIRRFAKSSVTWR